MKKVMVCALALAFVSDFASAIKFEVISYKDEINFYAQEKNSGTIHTLVKQVDDLETKEYSLAPLIKKMQERLAPTETDALIIFDQHYSKNHDFPKVECTGGTFIVTKAMTEAEIKEIDFKVVEHDGDFCRVVKN
jgi:hypothetical protein